MLPPRNVKQTEPKYIFSLFFVPDNKNSPFAICAWLLIRWKSLTNTKYVLKNGYTQVPRGPSKAEIVVKNTKKQFPFSSSTAVSDTVRLYFSEEKENIS